MGRAKSDSTVKQKLKDHLDELRGRMAWSVIAIVVASIIAYAYSRQLTAILQAPLHQKLYYTTPGGGFSFILKLSVLTGIIAALPVITYHIFAFMAPLVQKRRRGFVVLYAIWSLLLAYSGAVFAYYITLPAALKFLVQFGGSDIQALIGANDYFNFVLAYLAGFAILFQIPLFVLFIDKIRPLYPGQMMKTQRYLIAGSFIVAALFTPTPDPLNQLFMALPIILLYQLSIVLIWYKSVQRNRQLTPEAVKATPVHTVDRQPVRTAVQLTAPLPPAQQMAARQPLPPRRQPINDITPLRRPIRTRNTQLSHRAARPRQYMDFVPVSNRRYNLEASL